MLQAYRTEIEAYLLHEIEVLERVVKKMKSQASWT